MINSNSKIYISGHKGLVGSAILRNLRRKGYKNLIYAKNQSIGMDLKIIFNHLNKLDR